MPQGKLATGDDTSTNDEDFSSIPADAKLNVVGRSSTNEKKAKKVLWPIRISIFYYYAK